MGKNSSYMAPNDDSGSGLFWLIGLLLGILGGLTIGMLAAPKSGRELRSNISEGAKELPERVSELIEDTLDIYASGVNYAQLAVEEQTLRMKRAVAAGKLAAAKKREELDYSGSSVLPFQHH